MENQTLAAYQPPTILVYGTPADFSELEAIGKQGWGLLVDDGRARDVVFAMYENFARADAIVLYPNAHPAHITSIMGEAEVGHPLIAHLEKPNDASAKNSARRFIVKPIIFCGATGAWQPFKEMFSFMRAQGTLRDTFDHNVTYAADMGEAVARIAKLLPAQIPLTRVHYYRFNKQPDDVLEKTRDDVRPPSSITVACFGSASTKNPDHLARTEQVARELARNGFNILHGGGGAGVMGQLTKSGASYKAFVRGISVTQAGAPGISFERILESGYPEGLDHYVESKGMLHRIETYAGHSQAFLSLDGGIGTVMELFVVAELLSKRHPVTNYQTLGGRRARKPLLVLNEGGMYTPVIQYLAERKLDRLLAEIQVFQDVAQAMNWLHSYFENNPPIADSRSSKGNYRLEYFDGDLPMGPVEAPES